MQAMLRVLMAATCCQSSAACLLARLPVSLKPARPSQPGGAFFCVRIACNRRWSLHMVVATRNGHAIGAKSGFRALVHHGLMCGRKDVSLIERKSALQGLKNRGFHGYRSCGVKLLFTLPVGCFCVLMPYLVLWYISARSRCRGVLDWACPADASCM